MIMTRNPPKYLILSGYRWLSGLRVQGLRFREFRGEVCLGLGIKALGDGVYRPEVGAGSLLRGLAKF